MTPEPLRFTTDAAGRTRVKSWPDVVEISKHFLKDGIPARFGWNMCISADEALFNALNGRARYVRIRRAEDDYCEIHLYRKISSSLEFS